MIYNIDMLYIIIILYIFIQYYDTNLNIIVCAHARAANFAGNYTGGALLIDVFFR